MRVLVLGCSLNTDSRSTAMAETAAGDLRVLGAEVRCVFLRDLDLPLADAGPAHGHAQAVQLAEQVRDADAVLMGVPIYNYYANAAAKNAIELTGKAWRDKVVGFLCAAGGRGSYMSVMSLANSLMLDFRCLIVPRFVYATGGQFDDDGTPHADVAERIDGLCRQTLRLARALREPAAAT